MRERLNFKDMVDIEQWQGVQDHFSDVLGITLRTIDKECFFLTRPSGSARLCDEIVRLTPKGALECNCCLPHSLKISQKDWKEGYICPLIGLHNFSIPLHAGTEAKYPYSSLLLPGSLSTTNDLATGIICG